MAILGSECDVIGSAGKLRSTPLNVEPCEYLVYAVTLLLLSSPMVLVLLGVDFIRLRTGRSSAV